MGDENIHGWSAGEQAFDLLLVIQELAPGLVSPRPVESAETNPIEGVDREVQVDDRPREQSGVIFVAFDGKDAAASGLPCHLQDDRVRKVAQGHDEVGRLRVEVEKHPIIVCEDKDSHRVEDYRSFSGPTLVWICCGVR